MDLLGEGGDFNIETMPYHLSSAFVKVKKGEFRKAVAFEDLIHSIRYDAKSVMFESTRDLDREMVTGIYELKHPIINYDTFNMLAYNMNKKQELGTITDQEIQDYGIDGYENPGHSANWDDKLTCVMTWLSIINEGIDRFGMKKLVTYLLTHHLQEGFVTHKVLTKHMKAIMGVPLDFRLRLLRTKGLRNLKNKHVFFSNNSEYDWNLKQYEDADERGLVDASTPVPVRHNCEILTLKDKRKIVLRVINGKKKKHKQEIISLSITELRERDNYTKITDSRLSRASEIPRATVSRIKTRNQKKILKELDVYRIFRTEDSTRVFEKFINDYDHYRELGVKFTLQKLGISKSTYYSYMAIIKDEGILK
jgi:ribosomal protein L36